MGPKKSSAPAKAKPTQRQQKPDQIILSKRANVLFIEHARVVQKDGRVLYLTKSKAELEGRLGDEQLKKQDLIEQYFNVPAQNTSLLMLGQGTSITDSAARMLADANVMVGFVGSGGSPMFCAADPVFLPPQSEYRPTEYMQAWVRMWIDDDKRLQLAKRFLKERLERAEYTWANNPDLPRRGIAISEQQLDRFETAIRKSQTTEDLLSAEGVWVKGLYQNLARGYKLDSFARDERPGVRTTASATHSVVNGMLTHGNYIAYGFAAVALYAVGISYAMPVLHGKTRRGALVFDAADLFKDWTVLPLAFEMGCSGQEDQAYRNEIIGLMQEQRLSAPGKKMSTIEVVIDTIKKCVL